MHTLLICGLALSLLTPLSMAQPQDVGPPEDTVQQTTDSGLQYSILEEGQPDAAHPKLTDTVHVHYKGWLTNGTVFDTSYKSGEPAEFKIGQVIEGWNEGLALMTVGAKYKFTIPPELAYGENGSPPRIPSNSTLIFVVELLDLKAGPGLPAFQAPDPEKSKEAKPGLLVHEIDAGSGDPAPAASKIRIMHYTCWTVEGEVIESSAMSGSPFKASAERLPIPILKEAFTNMPDEAIWIVRASYTQAFPQRPHPKLEPGSDSIWRLESVSAPEMPTFDDDQWQKTESGLEYVVHADGEGDSPMLGDVVTAEYSGWLTDGSLFDTSKGGDPAKFQLGRVIAGWNEGLQLMKPGGHFTFRIPGGLAYGAQGIPGVIPPDATLVFDVQLIK